MLATPLLMQLIKQRQQQQQPLLLLLLQIIVLTLSLLLLKIVIKFPCLIFIGEVGASWRGNQFSYKLSAMIMPIYLLFLHNIPIDNSISKPKSRHRNILQVCKKRSSNFFKSQPTCSCAGASWLLAWGKMVANTDYTHKSYLK